MILGYTKHMNEWMASSQLMITKPGGITITEGFARCIPMIFLNPAPGQELENALYFEEKGFGKIADTPEEAIKIVASLTNGNERLTNMISTMEQDKIKYATQTICRDLLDLISNSSQPQEIYQKHPYMQDSSLNNYANHKNFILMLIILFLMEFARGMYILSYINFLPTVTSIAVAITSLAFSIHFIADASTNFVIGFSLKKFGTKIVLTTGFILAFTSLFLVIWFPASPFVIIFSAMMLGIAVSPIWVIMLSSVEEDKRGKQMGYVYFSWLLGLLVGMVFINLLIKVHPTHFAFMMSLVVLIAWILYYFVDVKLTNYNTRPVKAQLRQIVDVTKRHLLLFPGILYKVPQLLP